MTFYERCAKAWLIAGLICVTLYALWQWLFG
jgi:hypothetical protein